MMKHKATMKHIIFPFLFVSFLYQSCEEIDINEGVPSYINIPSIEVVTDPTNEGSNSHKITDAWVYFDNNLQGVYPLPASFPVLLSGKQNISIKAGIKNNGIAATRVKYPFYNYFNAEITLIKDSTLLLDSIVVSYADNLDFHIIDFETGSKEFEKTSSSDTTFLLANDTVFEGNSGGVHLVSPHLTFEIATEEVPLPKVGTPIYVELNYKCNTAFQVGVFANYPQTVTSTSILTINPKLEWNKIYIDLTSAIINTQNADSHKIFISMIRDINSVQMAELYLDNFKIVY